MTPDRRAVDHVLPVVGQTHLDQGLQKGVPDPLFGSASEADIDGIPLPVALVHVAPGTSRPQDEQHPIQKTPIVMGWAGLGTPFARQKFADHRPLLVRQIASRQSRPQKTALNQTSDGLGIHYVNRP